ncbi:hypothetical protein Tco_0456169 [Tanacetum coccineum]
MDSQRVDLLIEDRIAHQETILIVEEAWVYPIGLSQADSDPSNAPGLIIPLRPNLGVLQIGIRAKVIENQDQRLPIDASPTALSPGYVADSDLDEDLEEDHADYPADGGDDDDEPSDNDDDDTDDVDEEPFEDEDDDEEEEHLAPAYSSTEPIVDHVPSAGDTKAFETDEFAPTPRSPQTKVPFAQTHLRKTRKTVRFEQPMSPSMEARIAEYVAAPTPPSPPPSPLSHWSPSLSQIPLPLLPPPPSLLHLPPPVYHYRGESLTAAPRPTGGHRADYGFIGTTDAKIRRQRAEEVSYGIRDVWVDPTEAIEDVTPTTLEGVNARVTELVAV